MQRIKFKLKENAEPSLLMYHGSPYDGIESFDHARSPIFFTYDPQVAIQYATPNQVIGANNIPKSADISNSLPTLYKVKIKVQNIFDMRTTQHLKLYSQLRELFLSNAPQDDENHWNYPRVSAQGFLMSNTRLPSYAAVYPIHKILKDNGYPFDAIWCDEGNQGISLAIFEPEGKTEIIASKTILQRG
jgi:hypothetical protein